MLHGDEELLKMANFGKKTQQVYFTSYIHILWKLEKGHRAKDFQFKY